jgi:hypothetical protein
VSGIAGGTAAALMRGGRVVVQQIVTDSFGSAIGNSIAESKAPGSQAELASERKLNAGEAEYWNNRKIADVPSPSSGVQLASLDVRTSDALTPEEEALLAMQGPSDERIKAGVTAMDRNGSDVASDSYVVRIGNTLTRMTKSSATTRPRFDSAETNRLQDNQDRLFAKFWAGDVRLPYGQYPDETRLPIIYADKMSQQLGKKISPSDAEVLSLIDEIGQRIRTLDRQLSNQGSSKDAAANILQQNSLRRAVSDIRSGLIDAGNPLGTEIAAGELVAMGAQAAGNGVSGLGVAGLKSMGARVAGSCASELSAVGSSNNAVTKQNGSLGWPWTGGSGPAPGIVGITDHTSVGALKNYYPRGGGVEFVYEPATNTFVAGRPQNGLFQGSPHEQLVQSIGGGNGTIVGGTFQRGANGQIFTTENSGHYGPNWTPQIRQQFQDWLTGRTGVIVNHQPWVK